MGVLNPEYCRAIACHLREQFGEKAVLPAFEHKTGRNIGGWVREFEDMGGDADILLAAKPEQIEVGGELSRRLRLFVISLNSCLCAQDSATG